MNVVDAVRFIVNETTRFISPPLLAFEWVLAAAAGLIIGLAPLPRSGWLASWRRGFSRLAHRRRTAILICGILPVAIRLALLPIVPVPEPSIHDEFSHLLLADTLAHGRLSNPTHPMWRHFETIHVIQQPTYSSMYPPAQGIFLMAGQVLFHEPWAGVLISIGFMFAALCWMMQGWMSPPWALYGTFLAILKLGIFGIWINSYLGGAVSALAGALLFGALPRLRTAGATAVHSLLLGIALAILMDSRPFEGSILSLAALIYMVPRLIPQFQEHPALFIRRIIAPAGALVVLGLAFTGYYDFRVTGSPLKLPYQVNRATYGWPDNLAFLPAQKVNLHYKELRDMYKLEVGRRAIYKSPSALIDDLDVRLYDNWTFFIGPLLTIPLLAVLRIWKRPQTMPLLVFLALMACLNVFQLILYPYHLGPVVPIMFALVAQGSAVLDKQLATDTRPRALYLAVILPLCVLATGVMKQAAGTLNFPLAYWERGAEPHGQARADIEDWLSRRPGKQLVIVRYAPDHSPNAEWVYNRADIDGSRVIWAREMDKAANDRLLDYFHDRTAWLLAADKYPQHVVHYPRGVAPPDKTEQQSAIDSNDECGCARFR